MTDIRDDNEDVAMFEPLLVSEGATGRAELNDLAMKLAMKSAAFSASLPEPVADSLVSLIRSMNCYYSNLIEGHNTHPIDIEKAMAEDYSEEPKKRDLQLEAKAHIEVQKWIDESELTEPATTPGMIREIHRRFCEHLPESLLLVDVPGSDAKALMEPGAFRKGYVEVGLHQAVSPGAVERFLNRLHGSLRMIGDIGRILSAASVHHRLLWVHPFTDGNGRVARLVSYAMLKESVGSGGLWSVARGLARREAEYKAHLQACDEPRRGDRDGRGNLSEGALTAFTKFFLEVCIDQIDFMESLMKPATLRERILLWTEEEIRLGNLPTKSDAIMRAVLYQGELPKSEVPAVLGGLTDRSARRITSALVEAGALKSGSPRAPLQLAFPAKLAERWMPGLFPEG